MRTDIELILDTGAAEQHGSCAYADAGELRTMLRAALKAVAGRKDVVAVRAAHEGGEVRVDRMRPPEKAEPGVRV